jgi:putative nucleotidyltransferase with HDIG domain
MAKKLLAGARNDLIIAALFHDIGQIIPLKTTKEARMTLKENSPENVGRIGHESIGAEFLRSLGFGEGVCQLVGSHVAAKRFCSLFPSLLQLK